MAAAEKRHVEEYSSLTMWVLARRLSLRWSRGSWPLPESWAVFEYLLRTMS
jgi:hypothetical protein